MVVYINAKPDTTTVSKEVDAISSIPINMASATKFLAAVHM